MVPTNAVWISTTKTAVRGLGGSISYTDGTVKLENLSLAVGGVCREHPIKVLKPPRGVLRHFIRHPYHPSDESSDDSA